MTEENKMHVLYTVARAKGGETVVGVLDDLSLSPFIGRLEGDKLVVEEVINRHEMFSLAVNMLANHPLAITPNERRMLAAALIEAMIIFDGDFGEEPEEEEK